MRAKSLEPIILFGVLPLVLLVMRSNGIRIPPLPLLWIGAVACMILMRRHRKHEAEGSSHAEERRKKGKSSGSDRSRAAGEPLQRSSSRPVPADLDEPDVRVSQRTTDRLAGGAVPLSDSVGDSAGNHLQTMVHTQVHDAARVGRDDGRHRCVVLWLFTRFSLETSWHRSSPRSGVRCHAHLPEKRIGMAGRPRTCGPRQRGVHDRLRTVVVFGARPG